MMWKERARAVGFYAGLPLLYVVGLLLLTYLTFPTERLRDRIAAEFSKQGKGANAGQRLQIGELGTYWVTGIQAEDVRIILPPETKPGDDSPARETVVAVDSLQARVQMLPLLWGEVIVKFSAEAFGGNVSGTVPVGATEKSEVELEIEDVDLAQVEVLRDALGLPLAGVLTGSLSLSAPGGRFNKATGTLALTITDLAVGDGKTKIKDTLALPEAKIGKLEILAEAKEGVLKLTKLLSEGGDVELWGEGKVNLKQIWNDSRLDINAGFKFSDTYRGKNDVTKSLLGAPGSSSGGLLDMADPKMKRAKKEDGSYHWRVLGPIRRLVFEPARGEGAKRPAPGAEPPAAEAAPSPPRPAAPPIEREGDDGAVLPAPTPAMAGRPLLQQNSAAGDHDDAADDEVDAEE